MRSAIVVIVCAPFIQCEIYLYNIKSLDYILPNPLTINLVKVNQNLLEKFSSADSKVLTTFNTFTFYSLSSFTTLCLVVANLYGKDETFFFFLLSFISLCLVLG